jgi:hypothetical protein
VLPVNRHIGGIGLPGERRIGERNDGFAFPAV